MSVEKVPSIEELREIRSVLFNHANACALSEEYKGCMVAIHLHEAANQIVEAVEKMESGEKTNVIPKSVIHRVYEGLV